MADITITPASVVPPNANTTEHYQPLNKIAGEAINAGEIVCVLETDQKFYKADANDTAKIAIAGMAGNSAVAAGQRLDVITASPSVTVGAHGQAVGTPLFLSNTPGKLCPLTDLASGSTPVLVCYAATTTALQIIIAASTNAKP